MPKLEFFSLLTPGVADIETADYRAEVAFHAIPDPEDPCYPSIVEVDFRSFSKGEDGDECAPTPEEIEEIEVCLAEKLYVLGKGYENRNFPFSVAC